MAISTGRNIWFGSREKALDFSRKKFRKLLQGKRTPGPNDVINMIGRVRTDTALSVTVVTIPGAWVSAVISDTEWNTVGIAPGVTVAFPSGFNDTDSTQDQIVNRTFRPLIVGKYNGGEVKHALDPANYTWTSVAQDLSVCRVAGIKYFYRVEADDVSPSAVAQIKRMVSVAYNQDMKVVLNHGIGISNIAADSNQATSLAEFCSLYADYQGKIFGIFGGHEIFETGQVSYSGRRVFVSTVNKYMPECITVGYVGSNDEFPNVSAAYSSRSDNTIDYDAFHFDGSTISDSTSGFTPDEVKAYVSSELVYSVRAQHRYPRIMHVNVRLSSNSYTDPASHRPCSVGTIKDHLKWIHLYTPIDIVHFRSTVSGNTQNFNNHDEIQQAIAAWTSLVNYNNGHIYRSRTLP